MFAAHRPSAFGRYFESAAYLGPRTRVVSDGDVEDTIGRMMYDGWRRSRWIVLRADCMCVCLPRGSPVLGLTSNRGRDHADARSDSPAGLGGLTPFSAAASLPFLRAGAQIGSVEIERAPALAPARWVTASRMEPGRSSPARAVPCAGSPRT